MMVKLRIEQYALYTVEITYHYYTVDNLIFSSLP